MKNIGLACLLLASLASCCEECTSGEARDKYIQAIDAKMVELKVKITQLGREAGAQYEDVAADLQEMKEAAQEKLEQLKDAGLEAFEAMKPEMDAALEHLRQAYEKARDRLSGS